jgi:general secretion pathway protein M
VAALLCTVAPDALAQWLTQARLNARAVPAEAKLAGNGAGSWDGIVVLNLMSTDPASLQVVPQGLE